MSKYILCVLVSVALAQFAKKPAVVPAWWAPGRSGGSPVLFPRPALPPVPEETEELVAIPSGRNRFRNDPCASDLPSALSFIEPLAKTINPDQVVIFTGGDSLTRRQSGYPLLSADSITSFAEYHGHGLVFLDQVDYDKTLTYKNVTFHPMWHRIFALPVIRTMYPNAKYFVQMDDDILVPYKETDMLNHYINLMEHNPNWYMTYGEEPADIVLNAGFFIMKNADFSFNAYQAALDIGLERNAFLANSFGHEQEAITIFRKRKSLFNKIRVLKRRDGPYNFNTFARNVTWDKPAGVARRGDAFVHFLGQPADVRLSKMETLISETEQWYQERPSSCIYPIQYI